MTDRMDRRGRITGGTGKTKDKMDRMGRIDRIKPETQIAELAA
jgi:hypothetical protein